MFVAGFILGLLVAMLVGWFWFSQINNVSPFHQAVQKHVEEGEYREMFSSLESELEGVQEQIQKLGEAIAGNSSGSDSAAEPEDEEGDRPLSGNEQLELRGTASNLETHHQPLEPEAETKIEDKKELRGNRKREKQGEVLELWEEGNDMAQIARETGLGQGEVELILSLRNKLGERKAASGQENMG